MFDFLELGDEYSERQLQQQVLAKVQPFLREMGGVFAFLGSNHRLEISDKEYFIDFLLYHRCLKCLVAIDTKIGEFMPEYVGKMQFYLAALDDLVRMKEKGPFCNGPQSRKRCLLWVMSPCRFQRDSMVLPKMILLFAVCLLPFAV